MEEMLSNKRNKAKIKIKVTMWVIILAFAVWSFISAPNVKVIVPWALATICFVGWKLASRKTHKVYDNELPKKRVRRYK